MNTIVSFTVGQLIGGFLAVCAGLSCIALAISWIAKGWNKVREPEKKQNERITALERRVAKHDEFLDRDKERLEAIRRSKYGKMVESGGDSRREDDCADCGSDHRYICSPGRRELGGRAQRVCAGRCPLPAHQRGGVAGAGGVKGMKYRKKPVEVEAFRYDGDLIGSDGKPNVPDWAMKAYDTGVMYYDSVDEDSPPVELYISTLEGVHHAAIGDYIVRGV